MGKQAYLLETSFQIPDVCSVLCSIAPDCDTLHQLRNSPHASLSVLQESQGDSKGSKSN